LFIFYNCVFDLLFFVLFFETDDFHHFKLWHNEQFAFYTYFILFILSDHVSLYIWLRFDFYIIDICTFLHLFLSCDAGYVYNWYCYSILWSWDESFFSFFIFHFLFFNFYFYEFDELVFSTTFVLILKTHDDLHIEDQRIDLWL